MDVTIASECTWAASEDADWLVQLEPTTGQGSGRITMQAHSNILLTGRQGIVTVNGVSLVVRQDPFRVVCSEHYALYPAAAMAPATGSTIRVSVTTFEGCIWVAQSEAAWLTVPGPPIGNPFPGNVDVTVAPNPGSARTGIVRIAGLAFTVSQSAAGIAPCTYAIAPISQVIPVGGGVFVIQVTADAGCAWSAGKEISAFWISGIEPAGGAGDGTVSFTVPANTTGAARQGTLRVAGQAFSVIQAP